MYSIRKIWAGRRKLSQIFNLLELLAFHINNARAHHYDKTFTVARIAEKSRRIKYSPTQRLLCAS
jgi:hypothetical protein